MFFPDDLLPPPDAQTLRSTAWKLDIAAAVFASVHPAMAADYRARAEANREQAEQLDLRAA